MGVPARMLFGKAVNAADVGFPMKTPIQPFMSDVAEKVPNAIRKPVEMQGSTVAKSLPTFTDTPASRALGVAKLSAAPESAAPRRAPRSHGSYSFQLR